MSTTVDIKISFTQYMYDCVPGPGGAESSSATSNLVLQLGVH